VNLTIRFHDSSPVTVPFDWDRHSDLLADWATRRHHRRHEVVCGAERLGFELWQVAEIRITH
jgi:hypothetical protein